MTIEQLRAALALAEAQQAKRAAHRKANEVYVAMRKAAPAVDRRAIARMAKTVAANETVTPGRAVTHKSVHLTDGKYNDNDVIIYVNTTTPKRGDALIAFQHYAVGITCGTYNLRCVNDRRLNKGKGRAALTWDLQRGIIKVAPAGSEEAKAAQATLANA